MSGFSERYMTGKRKEKERCRCGSGNADFGRERFDRYD